MFISWVNMSWSNFSQVKKYSNKAMRTLRISLASFVAFFLFSFKEYSSSALSGINFKNVHTRVKSTQTIQLFQM